MHADSARTVFPKLLAYVAMARVCIPTEAVNLLISSSVHFVVQLQLIENVRRVVSIHEIVQSDGSGVSSNEVFSFSSGGLGFAALRAVTHQDLEKHGFSMRGDFAWA